MTRPKPDQGPRPEPEPLPAPEPLPEPTPDPEPPPTNPIPDRFPEIEAGVDPFTPPMPPKVTVEQATKLAESLIKGEPNREEIVLTVLSDKVRELVYGLRRKQSVEVPAEDLLTHVDADAGFVEGRTLALEYVGHPSTREE